MHDPSVPDQTSPDFTTPEGLRQVLIDLNTHNAWATSSVAAEIMVYATAKYTPVARPGTATRPTPLTRPSSP